MACNSSRAATAPFCADPVDHSRTSPIRAVSKLDSYLRHRPTHRLHATVLSNRRLTAAVPDETTEARQWPKLPPASRHATCARRKPLVSSDCPSARLRSIAPTAPGRPTESSAAESSRSEEHTSELPSLMRNPY